MDWLGAGVSLLGGLLGSDNDTSTTTQNRMDSRYDPYIFGADGRSGLLGSAFNLAQSQINSGGMNDMMRQGLEMQRQYLMSPQYMNNVNSMMGTGSQLMGGSVAGNPFTSGQISLSQPMQPSSPTRQQPVQSQATGLGLLSNNGGVQAATIRAPQQGQGQSQSNFQPFSYQTDTTPGGIDTLVRDAYQSIGRSGFGDGSNQIDRAGYDWWSERLRNGDISPQDFRAQFNGDVDTYIRDNPNSAYAQHVQNYRASGQTPVGNDGSWRTFNAQLPGVSQGARLDTLTPANRAVANDLIGQLTNGTGSGGDGGSISGGQTIGTGNMTDALNQQMRDTISRYGLVSPVGATLAAAIQRGMSVSEVLGAVNQAADPIGVLNAIQGWTDVDPGYDAWGGGSGGGGWGSGMGADGHGGLADSAMGGGYW